MQKTEIFKTLTFVYTYCIFQYVLFEIKVQRDQGFQYFMYASCDKQKNVTSFTQCVFEHPYGQLPKAHLTDQFISF